MHYVLTLSCPDRPGIVRALAEGVVAVGGNIVESAQFSDPVTGTFCMRTHFEAEVEDVESVRAAVVARLAPFEPVVSLRPMEVRRRALIMVSRFDHCLVDLLYRWQIGELPVEIAVVVSNHEDCREVVERAGLRFVHLPVTPGTKAEAEAGLLGLVEEHGVDFVVLARYMQVLSDDLCRRLSGRVINIHHSFLPGFKGARPYHQAFERGVKLIGATAHFVTADLDEGPIIEQDVQRHEHNHDSAKMARMGKNIETLVLARAVYWHCQRRIILDGSRTVIFK